MKVAHQSNKHPAIVMNLTQLKTVVSALFLAATLSACGKSFNEREVSRSTGVITEREVVEILDEKRKPSTSVRLSGGRSSGSGVGIGLSLLLPLGKDEPDSKQVSRFTLQMQDGSERVIDYEDDDLFIGDCVDVIEVAGSRKPPAMELSADSCAFAQ